MKKKILVIIALVLIIVSIFYIWLANWMHYTISKDIDTKNLVLSGVKINDNAITLDKSAKDEIVDALSSATFKRESREGVFEEKNIVIILENPKDNSSILFKYDSNGTGLVTNVTSGNTASVKVKKVLLDKLENVFNKYTN